MNELGKGEEIRRESLQAHITVISKGEKDATLCSSDRPIVLINTDTKLYAKILATRLKELMLELIHANQVLFQENYIPLLNEIKAEI